MKLEVLTSVMNTELRAKMIKAKLSSKFTNEKGSKLIFIFKQAITTYS